MKVTALPRVFNWNGLELPDPAPDQTPEQALQVHATAYPELTNATLVGPETANGRLVYKVQKAIGTKG